MCQHGAWPTGPTLNLTFHIHGLELKCLTKFVNLSHPLRTSVLSGANINPLLLEMPEGVNRY